MPPLRIAPSAYEPGVLPWAANKLVNAYALASEEDAKSPYLMLGRPGLKEFCATGLSGGCRGLFTWRGGLYAVIGVDLVRVNSLGVSSGSLGEVTGTGPVSFAEDSNYLVIQSSDARYGYDGVTLTRVTDSDFSGGRTVAWLDGYTIGDRSDSDGRFGWSDVGNPFAYTSSSFANAESDPDDAVAVKVFSRRIWVVGERTVSPYFNRGASSAAPFERINQGIIEIGTPARFSVATIGDRMYMVGTSREGGIGVYEMSGGQVRQVSNQGINTLLEGSHIEDAQGFVFSQARQVWYILTLPTADLTLAFNASTGFWSQWMSGTGGAEIRARWRGAWHASAWQRHFTGDAQGGKIYEIDPDTHTDDGDTIRRVLTVPYFSAGERPNIVSRFYLDVETGTAANQRFALSWSDDGGRQYGTPVWRDAGPEGSLNDRLTWHRLGRFYSRIFRIEHTDPARLAVVAAYIEGGASGR